MKPIEQLRVLFDSEAVGTLSYQNRQIWFQYDPLWLSTGFDLSPQTLAFEASPQLAPDPLFQGLHGVFNDSLPDGWGLLLMDRFFKNKMDRSFYETTFLDRLAYMGKRAMGALEYEPVLSDEFIQEPLDLASLARDATDILQGKTQTVLDQLRIQGGSPGGARPKVTVALSDKSSDCLSGFLELPAGFSHWLVKFRSEADPIDAGRIEKTYADMAGQAGLVVPDNRLLVLEGSEAYFAVKRFDREGSKKRHFLSMSGYVYADHRLPSLDYQSLLAATMVLTKNIQEVERAFRLMVFNVATHNKDDHAKNFAFVQGRQGAWSLAPAYDLTFSAGINNEHTTALNGSGNPTRADLEVLAKGHHIVHWKSVVEEVLEAVATWPLLARVNEVASDSIERIQKTFQAVKRKLQ